MKNCFGGSLLKNKRKYKRPLSYTESMHFVLRLKPQYLPMFNPRDLELRKAILCIAEKHNIKLYELILNHSHLHSVILPPNRKSYIKFVRELTAFLTNYFNKLLSFLGVKLRRLFEHRPFTRIVPWGKAYKRLKSYMRKNERESGVPQRNLNFNSHTPQMGMPGLSPPTS